MRFLIGDSLERNCESCRYCERDNDGNFHCVREGHDNDELVDLDYSCEEWNIDEIFK